MKQLGELLATVDVLRRSGPSVPVTSIEYDSRKVSQGTCFVAMKGGAADGNHYIQHALRSNASAIVTDTASVFNSMQSSHPLLPMIEVAHGRRSLAEMCRAFYDYPDAALGLTGITGTNGKTTTAFLLEQMLRLQGRKTILAGTIEYRIGDRVMAAPHTTPESRDLLALLAEGVAEGVSEAVMEVSSHALDQGRVWKLAYDVAIFTNLTRDHLDYHATMDAYLRAKQRLFDGSCSQTPKHAVINMDDPAGAQLVKIAEEAGSTVHTYGIERGDFRAEKIELTATGTSFTMGTPFGSVSVQTRLVGRINIYNLLAAAAAARARGVKVSDIATAAGKLSAPPGRFQTITCGQDFAVIVDYAHTDDALRNVTQLARELAGKGRVITLFGCGGDRDTTKRPLMGRAAGEGSDIVVVTSDNPRSEKPESIIEQILPGLSGVAAKVMIEPDRAKAIEVAIGEARTGDLVLIAGKGHEKTQTIGAQVLPFDDAAVAGHILAERGEKGRQ